MDGVLIDAMPFHAEAFQKAFREIVKIDIDKRNVFLLEGMPGPLLIREIFKRNNLESPKEGLVENISNRKKDYLKSSKEQELFLG